MVVDGFRSFHVLVTTSPNLQDFDLYNNFSFLNSVIE